MRLVYAKEKAGVSLEGKLTGEEVSKLEQLPSPTLLYCGESYEARQGATDYFTYRLELEGCRITWVDSDVSSRPIPSRISYSRTAYKGSSLSTCYT